MGQTFLILKLVRAIYPKPLSLYKPFQCLFVNFYMAKQKYSIQDIEIGDKVSFQRKLSDNLHENCEVLGKLDKHLLVIKVPGVNANMIIDIYEVTEVIHN